MHSLSTINSVFISNGFTVSKIKHTTSKQWHYYKRLFFSNPYKPILYFPELCKQKAKSPAYYSGGIRTHDLFIYREV